MAKVFSCRRAKREGNLFPVIFHLVSLCSDILHLLHQLFAACADRWLLLFDMHSPLVRSASLGKTFREKANLGDGLRWITLNAEEARYRGLPMRRRQSNYGNHPCARSTSRLKPELLRSGRQTAGRIRRSTGTLTGANELREGSSGEKMSRTHSLYSSAHTFTLCGHISALMHRRRAKSQTEKPLQKPRGPGAACLQTLSCWRHLCLWGGLRQDSRGESGKQQMRHKGIKADISTAALSGSTQRERGQFYSLSLLLYITATHQGASHSAMDHGKEINPESGLRRPPPQPAVAKSWHHPEDRERNEEDGVWPSPRVSSEKRSPSAHLGQWPVRIEDPHFVDPYRCIALRGIDGGFVG
ncbi:hypothetical protein EYF80_012832 [Liparis tanakae]|uniref:Uncharacterized protein n=1 Tax=Liparis tanakae TaxID=230148 RepID=A0A4Z2IG61_9TELE|nr:hypothetical protein EYF80_012832 [Liparis tanakae]